jgi:heme/copper-type cytochrome/quinol oxidase subunit 3
MSAVTATHELGGTVARRLAGDRDVWIFIIAELLMFGAFFVAYIVNRAREVELFNASQLTLDRTLGVLNTLLLVSSSWAVARARCSGPMRGAAPTTAAIPGAWKQVHRTGTWSICSGSSCFRCSTS